MNWNDIARSRVTSKYARATRIIGAGLEFHMDVDNASVEITLSLVSSNSICSLDEDGLTLESSHGQVRFGEGQRFFRALTGIDFDACADSQLQNWLSAAIVGRLRNTPFEDAQRLGSNNMEAFQDPLSVCIRISTDTHAFSVFACADAATWVNFLRHPKWCRIATSAVEIDRIPIFHSIKIASHTVSGEVLCTAQAGDIFIPRMPLFDSGGRGLIALGGMTLHVEFQTSNTLKIIKMERDMGIDSGEYGDEEYENSELNIDEASRRTATQHADSSESWPDNTPDTDDRYTDGTDLELNTEDTPTEHDNDSGEDGLVAEHSERIALDRVPVRIDFELGHLSLSLAQLKNVAQGVILQIEGGSPAAVSIKCADRALGTGEIVEVNGQLGIRIVRWS